MDTQTLFEKFYENIRLTKKQKEDAKTKYNGVCKKLHDHYYPETTYTGDTKLLIGSYGKHTNIRPPRDVDVLFIMPPEKFDQYNDNSSNAQSQLLQDIKNILSDKYTTSDRLKAWGKVVLIEFSDGHHNIELLPAWLQVDGKFLIPNTENGGHWDYWDSKAEIKKIQESNNNNNKKTIPLIRMIKKWSDNCTVKLKSYEIENGVLGFINLYNSFLAYSELVKQFLEYFHNITIDNSIKSHLKTALDRTRKACEFEQEDNLYKAVAEWKKIFGDDFPSCDDEKDVAALQILSKPIINPPKPHGYKIEP
ncbi:MAG: nucleotidyltransferase [Candidatus Azambacteria bacterium]|nr:nucleotidyltransferase [Candidatus Azambacteria bacterium]